jgi:TRAP-type uncharacterized transport system substrate-binding protein
VRQLLLRLGICDEPRHSAEWIEAPVKKFSSALPFWVRAVLLAGAICVLVGAGLVTYEYYMRPTTLSLAVGSLDGEARQSASVLAGHLATTNSSVRLKVESAGSVLDAAKALAAGKVDLAVVRADVGDFSQARTVALMGHGVAMIVAPPGSAITSIEKLKGHTVGVIGGDINHEIVEVLKKEYDLAHANVTFKDVAPADARHAVQSKEVSALLLVIPLTERYLSLVRGLFRESQNSSPVLIPIDSAAAIADAEHAYESFDIPKGTLRGAPAVPSDDVTTLRVAYYLVANRHLSSNLIADLTKKLMSARRDLIAEQPMLVGIAAPNLDPDAYISVHPGAAAYYNGTQQSFMDKYGNAIYLTPMILGAIASVFAAAWRFLGIRQSDAADPTFNALYALPRRIRNADNEADLAAIEDEVDEILKGQMAKAIGGADGALDIAALNSTAHRLENLIHHRRLMLAAKTSAPGAG